jgi:hypothetical protein
MNLIENKQNYLFKKAKLFLSYLKFLKIDTSKSSFCYINTYSETPGYGMILLWLKSQGYILKIIKIFIINIFKITNYSEFFLINYKKQKFNKIIMTWGNKKDFRNKIFYDKFSNIKSCDLKNAIFFVVYLETQLPKIIPENVVILFNNNKKSFFFLIKKFFKILKEFGLSFNKCFHYFSSQTIFAEIVNSNLSVLIGKNKIEKIVMPYEGQPFQNFVFKNLKEKFIDIKTIGFVHSMIPALPLNYIRRDGSPDKIFLSGNSQKNLFLKYLGWKKNQISVKDSIRIKKKIHPNQFNSIFFAILLNNIYEISRKFNQYLISLSAKSLPVIKIKTHPAISNSKIQLLLKKKIKKYIVDNKVKFSKKNKCRKSFHIGPTSTFLQYLENNNHVIHFTADPILDVYSHKFWRKIKPFKLDEHIYSYRLEAKNQILQLSNKNFNIIKAGII